MNSNLHFLFANNLLVNIISDNSSDYARLLLIPKHQTSASECFDQVRFPGRESEF